MSGHLGTVARLVPVVPTEAQQESRAPRFVFQESRSKRWGFHVARPDGTQLRSWSVDLGLLDSGEQASLGEFLDGQWGAGPFIWVPCSAHSGNVLTPAQTALAGVATGSADAVSGWAPRAHLGPNSTVLAARVPVMPGKPVSAGIDMSGGTLTLTWRNAAGSSVGTATKTATGSVMQRVTWSGVAPVTARTVDLTVSGHVAATRPQVAWEATLPPYVTGQAAGSVVIENGTVDMIARTTGTSYWGGQISIVEVA